MSYSWENLFCELCNQKFPDYIRHNGDKVEIVEMERPADCHYIMIERNVTHEDIKIRTVHIIRFNSKKKVSLGRGHDSNVRIPDISISRLHCAFRLIKKKEIWLVDLDSKFGTTVLFEKPMKLKVDTPFQV